MDTSYEQRSVVAVVPPTRSRKLAKVPFVELADGRLQGVVSSGSDPARVYVSSVSGSARTVSCSTNNNRPCGGLTTGRPCKHVQVLVTEAAVQYGMARVARYLRVAADEPDQLAEALTGEFTVDRSTPASAVFSSFLRHLSYLELPVHVAPVPELHWFPAAGGAA